MYAYVFFRFYPGKDGVKQGKSSYSNNFNLDIHLKNLFCQTRSIVFKSLLPVFSLV